jgi:hypothetical protein
MSGWENRILIVFESVNDGAMDRLMEAVIK